MLRNSIGRVLLAVSASLAAVVAAVVLQGVFFSPRYVGPIHSPAVTNVRRVSLAGDGRYAAVRLTHYSHAVWQGLKHTLNVCELSGKDQSPRNLELGLVTWTVVGARSADLLFVSSPAGDLYWLDLKSRAAQPRLVGRHVEGCATITECTADGAIVVVGNTAHTSAWRRETGQCLWQRTDIEVISGHFHVPTDRLFCGLVGGHCVELDPRSGATLDVFETHSGGSIALDVSVDGRRLAVLNKRGQCVVSDLETKQPLWVSEIPAPGCGPRFSPDGTCVLIPPPKREACVHVVSAATGELLRELRGASGEIAGIEVTSGGLVYAWDILGTVTAWDLASGALLRQFSVTCSPNMDS